jgi:hypothetical protein
MLTNNTSNFSSWLSIPLFIGAIVYGHSEFKKLGNGFMSFGQGFKIGFFISLVSSLMSSVFMYIYFTFIDDSILRTAREEAIMKMEDQGVQGEQMEFAMKIMDLTTSAGSLAVFGILGGILMGVIFSLIISAITKKDEPIFGA